MPNEELPIDSGSAFEPAEEEARLPLGLKGSTVTKAGSIMMASLLLSRVLGVVRDSVMAGQFGTGLDSDAYKLAVSIPDTLFMLIAGGGLSSAFIPIFSELYYTGKNKEAWKAFSVIVTLCSLVVTALIGIAWMIAPVIASFMAEGKTYHTASGALVPVTPEYLAQVVRMGRIMLPAQFAFLVGSVLLGTLYARKQFAAPGLAPNVYNVAIIIGAFLGGSSGLGIAGMPWGALIGAMIGNLLLPICFMIPQGGSFRPSLDYKAEGVKKFGQLLLPVIVGFSLPSWATLITLKFASKYSEGTNVVLSFANNLMMAPPGIFGQALALAAFPVLTQFFAEKRMDAYREQVTKTLRTVIYLTIPASTLMWALAPQIVSLIYGHGKANESGNLPAISSALRIYCLGITAWSVQPVLMRGFFSMHKTVKPVVLGSGVTILFWLMCVAARAWSSSPNTLVWASNAAAILLVVLLYVALQIDVGKLDLSGILVTSGKSLAGAVIAGTIAYSAFLAIPASLPTVVLFLLLAIVFSSSGWAYFAVTKWLGMPESDYLARSIAKRRNA